MHHHTMCINNAQEAIQFTRLIYRLNHWCLNNDKTPAIQTASTLNTIRFSHWPNVHSASLVRFLFLHFFDLLTKGILQNRQYFKTMRIQIEFSTHQVHNRNKGQKSVDIKFLGQFTMTTGFCEHLVTRFFRTQAGSYGFFFRFWGNFVL